MHGSLGPNSAVETCKVRCTQRSESYRPGGTCQCSMDHFFVELGWSSGGSAESAEREIPAHKVPKDSQGCLELGRQRPVPMTNPPDTDDDDAIFRFYSLVVSRFCLEKYPQFISK